jgi:lactate permease
MPPLPINLINWLLAFSPIAIVLVLMVGFRWGGSRAGPVGWVAAILVAWLRFGAGSEVLAYSQLRAILLTVYVLYIIWMALVLYHVVDEAGAITVIGAGIVRLTADPTMQLLMLAWAFSAFLQGVAGFGVPIAVVGPLLIGLGFPPVVAVAAVAIGHSWSVTFGDIASSFQALMAATGLPGRALAPWSAALLGVACFGCGLAAAWTYGGRRSVQRGWPALVAMGTGMALVQGVLAVSGLWNLAGFGAGLAGLGVGAVVSRLPRYQWPGSGSERDVLAGPPGEAADQARSLAGARPPVAAQIDKGMSLGLALTPYLLLVVVVTAAELWPWLHQTLNEIQLRVVFPEVQTRFGWITPAGAGRSISIFGHAGALLAYVSLATWALYWRTGHLAPSAVRCMAGRTVRSAVPSSIGIASMVGFAVAMDNSGMTYVLASGLSQVAGSLYSLVAPFIGLLGAFMTGSNTNSNVVFAPLQQQAAELLQISALVILAAQTTGGSLGSMLAPAKVIVGCSTAGLSGREGQVLKKTLGPGLVIAGVVGLVALVATVLGAS